MFNNDVNIFYTGGSGGFFLLHNILLLNKHNICVHSQAMNQSYINSKGTLLLDKDNFDTFKRLGWPSYEEYYNLNVCNKNYISKINDYTLQEISTVEKINGSIGHHLQDYMDFVIDFLIKNQWTETGSKWKWSEIWPDNLKTLETYFHNHRKFKIYFTCNDIDQWVTYPGTKIVLYTDLKSQIRLAWYKKANWFCDKHFHKMIETKKMIKHLIQTHDIQNQIHTLTKKAINICDYAIKLQDIIHSPDKFHFVTQAHKDLKFRWLQNHPNHLLKKCHIDYRI